MLTRAMQPAGAADAFDFATLRATEFARLDAAGIAYLDYAASALYGASQARAHGEQLALGIFGNPHSEHLASRNSAVAQAAARAATLAFFDADPDLYDVCFTANATAAIKLVAESYPFSLRRGLILSADNHNSVNGMREFARRAQAPVNVLPLDAQLRLEHASANLHASIDRQGGSLFAFPQQSNFSGVLHDLSLIKEAQALGCDVLVDAAAAGPSGALSLREHAADFVVCSFYKLFGLPTGVGALIAKRSALSRLRRPWFSGGTVEFVSVAHGRHSLKPGHEGFEDGTPNFLDLAAIESGFAFLARMPRSCLRAHIQSHVQHFLGTAATLRHRNGTPLVRLYGPADMAQRGGIVAFNVLQDDGSVLPYEHVEQLAREHGVAIRGGCFCNPGAAEKAFGLDAVGVERCFDKLEGSFSMEALRNCAARAVTVGALRLSVGAPTTREDIERALALMAACGVD
ncbi:aminotransferase class V-fold PLP-dependent enzyme [Dyella mobilis]|uniref:Aminotransferase class V-fold PLP-dependent enzyme n=1 Tax=Dyella mobilis TaxID=1849582 RepID=A0ABS2KCU4_9GAMM|nr:aminotransferase class V-fold PLP-dependent enzyme [Dyella mobilis]MBM7129000.1 aminotransferase class V-fold PLP-dependent enzyme [Dyella mobilis]GLQ99305.1 aminotransferase class V-fold PLP-dependent enzyme [Dyella mobilis]